MDENYAINEDRFAANLTVVRKEVSRSYDDFITEHFRKYSEPDLAPIWKKHWRLSLWAHFTNYIPTFRMLLPNTL